MGEKLAATKAGVVAFATSRDAELGEYDERLVGFQHRSRTHEGAAPALGDVRRLQQLEVKNARLKKLVAERDPEIEVMNEGSGIANTRR